MKNLIENKIYLRYLTTRSGTDKIEYKRLVAIVIRETIKIKRQCLGNICIENWTWLTWTPDKCIKIIKNLNGTEKDNLQINPIPEHKWLDHYKKFWTKQFNDNTIEGKSAKLTKNCIDLITMEEQETAIKTLKAWKSPGWDGINNELYKHAPKSFLRTFLNFVNVCWI